MFVCLFVFQKNESWKKAKQKAVIERGVRVCGAFLTMLGKKRSEDY